MEREEFLAKVKKIIESGNYQIEELLNMVPEEYLEDVGLILKETVEKESEKILEKIYRNE